MRQKIPLISREGLFPMVGANLEDDKWLVKTSEYQRGKKNFLKDDFTRLRGALMLRKSLLLNYFLSL